ncbi:MAG: iron ABC transporter permease [Sphaerochaeta sp.]|jgi:iron(III) transport system permease protein|uniref:ABC transporter permease n=3 Tax=Sphaerochaeta TaxID=399320 RepID=UPI000AC10484|nr:MULTISPECIES: iron ABC transporter permease [unclassified Sphaerochaeta]MCK9600678.1 iron ABC transporter permease [Sphaerochaeta sp.]MEA4864046.1 iron ABC transporter permease [Sphaerochaeta sp.]HPE92746.1 iron ABC transporter permease [Sphaerochaeta sp.]
MKQRIISSWHDVIRLSKDPLLLGVILLLLISLVLFIIYPLYKVVVVSFQVDGSFSIKNFTDVMTYSNGYYLKALFNSLWMGVATAVLGTFIAYIFAYSLTRANIPGRKFFNLIATIPIISPPFIGALAVIMLFGRNGFVSSTLLGMQNANVYGPRGLLFAQVLTFFPVAYITLRGVLESISPTLEDAAMDLGGNRFTIFRKVTLPLSIPGIASSMLVLFVESLADFGNPLVLAGAQFPILSVQAYLEITGMGNFAKGAALAFILLVPSVSAYLLQKYWVSKKQYVTVTGKPTQSSNDVVSPTARRLLFVVCCLIAACIILVYASIVWGAFAESWGNSNKLTLQNFVYVWRVGFESVLDTLVIAGLSTPLAGTIGMVIAFLVVRKQFWGRKFMEFSSMLSFALPGTVVGIGYILAFNQHPFYLTGTLLILLLNFIFRYLPVGVQGGVAVLKQIDPSIEEAAIDLGADSNKTFRKVTLPLMIPAFFSSLIFSFVRSMTAISAAIFLVSARWKLMTVQIMSQVESGRIGAAAAFSLILVAIILAAMAVIKLILRLKYHTTSSILSH